jgi:hypothetical protein
MINEHGVVGAMRIARGNQSTWKKSHPTDLTGPGVGSRPYVIEPEIPLEDSMII